MNTSIRPRRLRSSAILREMVKETRLSASELVQPLFITYGKNLRIEIKAMPGQYRFSTDRLKDEVREIWDAGVKSVLLFGIPEAKDEKASGAYAKDGIVQQAISAVKEAVPDIYVVTDVCLCEYMSHGHCGILKGVDELRVAGLRVENDATLELLAKTAVSHAQAGADMVAPSDMMDGRVAAIRRALDSEGFVDTPIMSYAAKYCSAFYGPFREAADSAPKCGDRKTYQMDPSNVREAIKEVKLDIAEGADIVMVKPALAYLDVISRVKAETNVPLAAYNVSGEYSMIKAAAANGWLDEDRAVQEMLTSIKRAGADIIITYFAKKFASKVS